MRRLLPVVAAAILAVSGCSEIGEEIDRATDEAAAEALESAIRDQLNEAGIELEGDPECDTDLSRDGTALAGTADCTGTTVDGQNATATFDGTLSTSGCEGSLTIEVDGRQIVDMTEVPGCSVEL